MVLVDPPMDQPPGRPRELSADGRDESNASNGSRPSEGNSDTLEVAALGHSDAAESPPVNVAASTLPSSIDPSVKDDFVADLTKLAELHAVGALTEEEYGAAKARVLRSSVEGAVAVQAAPVAPRRRSWRAVLPLTLAIGLVVVLVLTAAITIVVVSPTSTGQANATKIQTNAAAIEMNRAAELDSDGRHADAETIYQKVIDTYSGDPDPVTRGNVAVALGEQGRLSERFWELCRRPTCLPEGD